MRREEQYLEDVIDAADAIEAFIYGVEREGFLGNDLLRSAVLQKLSVIGEAAARLPEDFRKRHPEIEWRDIADFRNIAIHAYFAVDWSIVWVAAAQETPALRSQVARILSEDYPS